MLRIFNKSNRLFLLESGADRVLVAPRKVLSVDERFAEDITYRMAVAAGDLEELSGGQASAAAAEETVLQTAEEKQPETIQHPDTMEETEARRREDAATGRVTRGRKKE